MAEDPASRRERLRLVGGREMRDTALRRMDRRAAETLRVDILVGHCAHDIRPGDEHVARLLDHHDEVGDRRRIHRATGAWPEDDRELRHDAGGQRVAQEDVGVAAERNDALLDSGTARIVQSDDRRADLHGEIHDLADLLGVRLAERAAEDREVLAEDEDEPAIDRSVAGDDTVTEDDLRVEAEVRRAVSDERVELDERIGIEQQIESLACRQLAAAMLLGDPVFAATEQRLGAHRSAIARCVRHWSATLFSPLAVFV